MPLRITKIKARVYETAYLVDEETGESRDVRRVKRHAEYAIIDGVKIKGVMRKNNYKWIVFARDSEERFGLAISPINLTSWRDVRRWALRKWK